MDCWFPLPADAMKWTRKDEEPIDESSSCDSDSKEAEEAEKMVQQS